MQITQAVGSPHGLSPAVNTGEKLEQLFLEEMLKHCGPRSMGGDFGGGIGEEQFSSFLIQEYAAVLSSRIDLGFGKEMGLK